MGKGASAGGGPFVCAGWGAMGWVEGGSGLRWDVWNLLFGPKGGFGGYRGKSKSMARVTRTTKAHGYTCQCGYGRVYRIERLGGRVAHPNPPSHTQA